MKNIPTFVIAFLVFGFFFIAMPEKGNAGILPPPLPGGPPCCQLSTREFSTCAGGAEAEFTCENNPDCDSPDVVCVFLTNSTCVLDPGSDESARCVPISISTSVPTLSEWGLAAMAGILGIIGFMVIRRRKATA